MPKSSPQKGRMGLSVHSLIERLSAALYKRPHVAVRELLQNAHDATVFMRRKLAEEEPSELSNYAPEVHVDFEQIGGYRCLTVRDNGIGMTERDLREELSVIGQSSKAEDLSSVLKSRLEGDRVIGQYGIGFLAAFMVGKQIDVYTRQRHGKAWHWWCAGDEDYFLEELPDSELDFSHGTKVSVRLKPNDSLPPEFGGEIDALRKTTREYAALLQVKVWVRGQLVNRSAGFWRTREKFLEYPEKDMTEFLRERFPIEYLDVFRVCEFSAKDAKQPVSYRAALFIGITGPVERALGYNISPGIDVYARGMFVCRVEMMPTYVNFVHGAIDFDHLNLDLSREAVRQDELFAELQVNLGRKVIERLQQLQATEKLRRIVHVHFWPIDDGLSSSG